MHSSLIAWLMFSGDGEGAERASPQLRHSYLTGRFRSMLLLLLLLLLLLITHTKENRCNKIKINGYREGLREGNERQKKKKKKKTKKKKKREIRL